MSHTKHVGVNEMITTTAGEARRILTVQDMLVKDGDVPAPDEGMLRRAEVFNQTANFIARLTPYASDIRAMLDEQPGRVSQFMRRR